ncbi:DUF4350 domain-containing protein [Flagellimonas myxillae]|uniref:DUF4350 domain-containing protein n=1 Tax=Flagellimonas myxillae TaxID=2942214 RepID=UPI00201E8BE0|nr:DUF4350 domain-containing protein [Muricauda myxillae]MCL6266463.1 DUF4350 domain-containing protein [Muricauda myxillae]
MFKKGRIYIVIGIFTMGLVLLLEYNKPKKVNWFPSYVAHHKIPYGTYVLNDLLEQFYPNRVQQIGRPPFEFLSSRDSLKGTYFFINQSVYFDEAELYSLLDWVQKGNTLFVASQGFDEVLLDTLQLEEQYLFSSDGISPTFHHRLVNPNLDTESVTFDKNFNARTFKKIDTLNTIIVGEVLNAVDSTETQSKGINVIQQSFGEGNIILSTFPEAFTNYFMLKDNYRNYTAGLLSYLPSQGSILMDNHYKEGKTYYTSPMYLFLNTKEFKWAYYLVLIGALFYIIFEGKRKQRAIPVVTPLKNQTLAFTRTIADMYFENGEQKQITSHKIAYFLDYIRSRLHLPTQQQDDTFLKNLALRSNNELDDVQALFKLINSLKDKPQISDTELEELNKKIEAFKAKADGK